MSNKYTNTLSAAAMSLQVSPHVLQAFLEPMRQASEWDARHVKGGQTFQVSAAVQSLHNGVIVFNQTHFNGQCIKE